MSDQVPSRSMDVQKERTADALARHYTRGDLELDELEARLDRVYRSGTVGDLDEVLLDLPSLGGSPSTPSHSSSDVPRRKTQFVGALMGGTEHKGSWRPAPKITAVAFMGAIVLDFREADFAPGATELTVLAVMGGVEVIVPPGLRVECEGLGVMGGFEGYSSESVDPRGPTLRIDGLALFGGVEVRQRYPSESAKAAKKRLRADAAGRRVGGVR